MNEKKKKLTHTTENTIRDLTPISFVYKKKSLIFPCIIRNYTCFKTKEITNNGQLLIKIIW